MTKKKIKYLRARVRTVTSVVFEEVWGDDANMASVMHPQQRPQSGTVGEPIFVDQKVISNSSTMCNAIIELERADKNWKNRIIRQLGGTDIF